MKQIWIPRVGPPEVLEVRDGPDPTQPSGPSYPGYQDPAYAGQSPYGPPYQQPPAPEPTRQLPTYSPYGHDPYSTGQYGTGQYGGFARVDIEVVEEDDILNPSLPCLVGVQGVDVGDLSRLVNGAAHSEGLVC